MEPGELGSAHPANAVWQEHASDEVGTSEGPRGTDDPVIPPDLPLALRGRAAMESMLHRWWRRWRRRRALDIGPRGELLALARAAARPIS
eukprot:13619586-Alexandrium_andersonii.AAC.1